MRIYVFLLLIINSYTVLGQTFNPVTVADLINDINTANSNDQDDIIDLSLGSPFVLTAADNGVNGLPVILPDNAHSLLVQNGIIQRNSADPFRFFEVSADANLSLSNVTLQNGNPGAAEPGGAIVVDGVLNSVTGSTFSQNQGGIGAVIAIRAPDGNAGIIANCTFDSNLSAQAGGAISVFGTLGILRFSVFTGNRANLAGAIYVALDAEIGLIADTVFANNAATPGAAGAILVAGSVATIQNSVFSRNAGNGGGAIYLANTLGSAADPPGVINLIEGSLFLGNKALVFGGAIGSTTQLLTAPVVIGEIRDSKFINNTGFQGGALSQIATRINTIDRTTFGSNSAFVSGGAIFMGSAKIDTIENSTFNDNSITGIGVGNDGGAIFLASENSVPCSINLIDNSTFSGNQATGNGGVLSLETEGGADTVFVGNFSNSTLANNSAGGSGGALYLPFVGSIGSLISTIVAKNLAVTAGPDVSDIAGAITVERVNFIGNNSGSDFIAGLPNSNGSFVGTAEDPIDPLLGPLAFNGGPTETLALSPQSLAIDTGSNPLNLLYDQRGPNFARMSGVFTDIGAFELQQGCPEPPVPPEPDCGNRHRKRHGFGLGMNVGGFISPPLPLGPPPPPPPPPPQPIGPLPPPATAPLTAVSAPGVTAPAASAPKSTLPISEKGSLASGESETKSAASNQAAGCSSTAGAAQGVSNLILLILLMGLRKVLVNYSSLKGLSFQNRAT